MRRLCALDLVAIGQVHGQLEPRVQGPEFLDGSVPACCVHAWALKSRAPRRLLGGDLGQDGFFLSAW